MKTEIEQIDGRKKEFRDKYGIKKEKRSYEMKCLWNSNGIGCDKKRKRNSFFCKEHKEIMKTRKFDTKKYEDFPAWMRPED